MRRESGSGFLRDTNTGSTAVALSDISIRFWINDTSGDAVVPHVWYGGCVVNVDGNPSCVHQVSETAVDVTAVYALGWVSLDLCATQPQAGLYRIPQNGGARTLLTTTTDTTGQLLLDNDAIYWSEPGNGKIRKLYK